MIDLPFYRDFGFPSAEYIDEGFWVLHERGKQEQWLMYNSTFHKSMCVCSGSVGDFYYLINANTTGASGGLAN